MGMTGDERCLDAIQVESLTKTTSDGLQPTSDGLHPSSDGLQPTDI